MPIERGETRLEQEAHLGVVDLAMNTSCEESQAQNPSLHRVSNPMSAYPHPDQNPTHLNHTQPAQSTTGDELQDQNPNTLEPHSEQVVDAIRQADHDTNFNGPQAPPRGTQPHTGNSQSTTRLGVKKTRAAMKVASLNIRGGGSIVTRNKWQHINQLLREEKICILAVQETHLSPGTIIELHNQFPSRLHILNSSDPGQPNAKGVAFVLNKQRAAWKEAKTIEIIPGRAILLVIPWLRTTILNVLAIYAPNTPSENSEFWDKLYNEWTSKNHPIPDVMLGDFNMVEDHIDRLPAHGDSMQSVSSLARFKNLISMQDGWRDQNPAEKAFSYIQAATNSMSRIDRIYASEVVCNRSRQWKIDRSPIKTDHSMVSMEFTNPGAPYIGKGRWSVPLYTLRNRKVLQKICSLGKTLEEEIDVVAGREAHERSSKNPQTLFCEFKKEVTGYIRELSRTEAPKMESNIKKNKLWLRQVLNEKDTPEEERQIIAVILQDKIHRMEAQCHMKIRDNLAARHRIEGETISKYWVQVNKEKRPRDTLFALRKLDSPVDSPVYEHRTKRMAALASNYHNELQSEGLVEDLTDEEVQEILDHLIPRVTQPDKARLAEYLKESEVKQAIRDLPNGKAPGIDGIPHELCVDISCCCSQLGARHPLFVRVDTLGASLAPPFFPSYIRFLHLYHHQYTLVVPPSSRPRPVFQHCGSK